LAGDYAASIGTTGFDYTPTFPPPLPPGPPPNGAFIAVRGLRFADFPDGLGNTLLVGEKHVPRGLEGLHPLDCGIYDGHNPACVCRAAGPGFPLALLPNDPNWLFGSRHPGITQFTFADGRVQPLTNSIDPFVLGLLASRNDGQVIPDY
jgi:hypothetical protein